MQYVIRCEQSLKILSISDVNYIERLQLANTTYIYVIIREPPSTITE